MISWIVLNLPRELWFNGQCLLCPKLFNFPLFVAAVVAAVVEREWAWRELSSLLVWRRKIYIQIWWNIFPYTHSSYELDMYRSGQKISRTPMLSMKIFMPNISTLEQWLCWTAAGVSPMSISMRASVQRWRDERNKNEIKTDELRVFSFIQQSVRAHQSEHEKSFVIPKQLLLLLLSHSAQ